MTKIYKVMLDEDLGPFSYPVMMDWSIEQIDEKIAECNRNHYFYTLEANKYGADIYMAIYLPTYPRRTWKDKIKTFFKKF